MQPRCKANAFVVRCSLRRRMYGRMLSRSSGLCMNAFKPLCTTATSSDQLLHCHSSLPSCQPSTNAALHRGVVFCLLFHPKQLTVVSGADDAEVRVWDLVDKSCIAVLKVRAAFCLVSCMVMAANTVWLTYTELPSGS